MTALGLAVAVPAVLGYNWVMRRNKAASEQLGAFASDLYGYMMSGGAVRPVSVTDGQAPVASVKAPVSTPTASPRACRDLGVPRFGRSAAHRAKLPQLIISS